MLAVGLIKACCSLLCSGLGGWRKEHKSELGDWPRPGKAGQLLRASRPPPGTKLKYGVPVKEHKSELGDWPRHGKAGQLLKASWPPLAAEVIHCTGVL